MSNDPKRVVLAPDYCQDPDVQSWVERWRDHGVLFTRTDREVSLHLHEPEARHLRDWLCQQFGLPEDAHDYCHEEPE